VSTAETGMSMSAPRTWDRSGRVTRPSYTGWPGRHV
jgi:hypothetical protein